MKSASVVALVAAVLLVGSATAQTSPTLAFAETVPELSNFTAALEFSRLYEVLDGPDGPYTIFAPTNEGFVTSLTPFESTVEDFLTGGSDEAAHTGDHLKYHVVRGTVRAADLSPGLVLNSIMDNGAAFTIQESRYNAGQFYAVGNNTYYERGNRGKILEADIAVPGSENIVHIINQFLFTEDE
ncbi:hypothetical protein ACKKBG_A14725 [Auxenochlorella protothecoides x Auxenochlorella symbiontica]|uniref:FAS1 domain-containing protein n=1 Tax=Auxenochlorella protothecoides TaxID=3075 RepID=A0A1D2A5Z1_AUXPR